MDGTIRDRTSPCLQTVLHWSFLHFTLIAFSGVLGFTRVDNSINVPCGKRSYALRMAAFSILPHAGFGQNDHRKDTPHIQGSCRSSGDLSSILLGNVAQLWQLPLRSAFSITFQT